MILTFRVREYARDIKGAPGHSDFKNYWVYVSPEFWDYYQAILYAIQHERKGGYKCWVECLMDADPIESW